MTEADPVSKTNEQVTDDEDPTFANNDKKNNDSRNNARKPFPLHFIIKILLVVVVAIVVTVVAVVLIRRDNDTATSSALDENDNDKSPDMKSSDSSWNQVGETLYGRHTGEFKDVFGRSVALNAAGTILAAGVPGHLGTTVSQGHVQVFQLVGKVWNPIGQTLDGKSAEDAFGMSVALSGEGTILAAGAPYNDGNGESSGNVQVKRFDRSTKNWIPMGQELVGEGAGDLFGDSVALSSDGTVLAVGAPFNDVKSTSWSPAGHVRVFRFNGTRWNQMGQDLNGAANFDGFGAKSVALSSDGTILAAGAAGNDGSGVNAGHVRVFAFNGTYWNQLGQDMEGKPVDAYGSSVALSSDGSIVVSGGTGLWPKNGQVTAFHFDGTKWNQMGQRIGAEQDGDQFGKSVALSFDGNILAASSPSSNNDNVEGSGRVKMFEFNGTHWDSMGQDLNGHFTGEWFGSSVALSSDGKTVAGGSPGHDVGDDQDVGAVRVYQFDSRKEP